MYEDEFRTHFDSPYDMVYEFHKAFGRSINQPFDTDNYDLRDLRWTLIGEEVNEVYKELLYDNEDVDLPASKKDLTKELADLMYVVIGTAISFGLPLQEVFEETHRSNMSKLDENGKLILRQDGKVLKGPNYKEPQLDKYFT